MTINHRHLFVLALVLACSNQVVNGGTNANLQYDNSFDPRKHSEPGKRDYHIDLNTLIDQALTSETELKNLYNHYRAKHRVSHGNHETTERLRLFKQYLVRVQKLRRDASVTWTPGITFMAHMTDCEKSLLKLGNRTDHLDFWNPAKQCSDDSQYEANDEDNVLQAISYPTSYDWRASGAVTPVKDQASTGHCWAFAAVTVMEAWLMKLRGHIDELSTQELADCVYYGQEFQFKSGGMPHHALNHVKNEKRLGYRYQIKEREEGVGGSCSYGRWAKNALEDFGVEIDRVVPLFLLNLKDEKKAEDYMKILYKISPVVVVIRVDNDLDTYIGGPFDPRTSNCAKAKGSHHAVAIVGYDSDYFYIKNSWGPEWGNDGYLWWIKAPGGEDCNMYAQPSFITMKITRKKLKMK